MEHKADLVEIARESGLSVWREFPEQADQVFGGPGPYDVFLSFNFLEHQPRPDVMLQAIYRNLADDGMGLVTVPALEYILEQGSYYELIRDHIAYYSFDTLRALMEKNGFVVLEEEMLNRDTISVIVKKNPEWTERVPEMEPKAGSGGRRRQRNRKRAVMSGSRQRNRKQAVMSGRNRKRTAMQAAGRRRSSAAGGRILSCDR